MTSAGTCRPRCATVRMSLPLRITAVRNAEPDQLLDPADVDRPDTGDLADLTVGGAAADHGAVIDDDVQLHVEPLRTAADRRCPVSGGASTNAGDRVGGVRGERLVIGAGLAGAEDALDLRCRSRLGPDRRPRVRTGTGRRLIPSGSVHDRHSRRRCCRLARASGSSTAARALTHASRNGTSPCSATAQQIGFGGRVLRRRTRDQLRFDRADNRPARTAASVAGNCSSRFAVPIACTHLTRC